MKQETQTENAPKRAAISILESHGWLVLPQLQNRVRGRTHKGKRGVPDLLAFKAGKCVGIEVKTKTGIISQDQIRFAEAWFRAGMEYYIYRQPEDLDKVLKRGYDERTENL